MAGERSRGAAAGSELAPRAPGNGAGRRVAVGGDGAALWLLTGGVSPPLRSQPELGIAAPGVSRDVAGSHPATNSRRQDPSADSHKVSGPRGSSECTGLRAVSLNLYSLSLRFAASLTTLCGLARRDTENTRADSGRTGAVFEDTARCRRSQTAGGKPAPGSGDRHCHPAARKPARE